MDTIGRTCGGPSEPATIADGGTTVGDSEPEGVNVSGLVGTGETVLVSSSVLGNMLDVALREP